MNKVRLTIILFVFVFVTFSSSVHPQTNGWGRSQFGQTGLGVANARPTPAPISNSGDFTAISGGADFTLFSNADGTVAGVGDNQSGQLGDGTTNSRPTILPVQDLANVADVSAGCQHAVALLGDGTVKGWGQNTFGQTGVAQAQVYLPATVNGVSSVTAVDAGCSHSLALKSDGTVWAWGQNLFGQLGNGTTGGGMNITPTQVGIGVSGFENIIAISAGDLHNIALKNDGTVWVWGNNDYAQAGNGTAGGNQPSPVMVSGLSGVAQIVAGFSFNTILKPDGTVFSWGFNVRGNMGNGTVFEDGCRCQTTPTQSSIAQVIEIQTAGAFTVARKRDGTVWTWGFNQFGEAGDGTIYSFPSGPLCLCNAAPVQASVGAGNALLGVGYNHGFAGTPMIATSIGSNVLLRGKTFSINFSAVSGAGTTSIIAIDPNSTGLNTPADYSILANSPAYQIATSAVISGDHTVCLTVPTVSDPTTFAALALLHGEGASLVDRTSSRDYLRRTICGSVSSLSPFVIARDLSPTAANVSVAGRVTTMSGLGISNVRLTLTGENGLTRTATSSSFGYFRFYDVTVGQTYIVMADHRRFQFAPRVLNVMEKITDLSITPEQ